MVIGGKEYEQITITDSKNGFLASITDEDVIADGNYKVECARVRNKVELPKSVNILGIDYEVVECRTIDKFNPAFGRIDYANQTIKIDSTLSEQKKGTVLMHEILHGIFEGLGMDDFNDNESTVQRLASALYCTLAQNDISFLGAGK